MCSEFYNFLSTKIPFGIIFISLSKLHTLCSLNKGHWPLQYEKHLSKYGQKMVVKYLEAGKFFVFFNGFPMEIHKNGFPGYW